MLMSKLHGPIDDGKVMPRSLAQSMLAKLTMPVQMADASAALMSKLMSDALR